MWRDALDNALGGPRVGEQAIDITWLEPGVVYRASGGFGFQVDSGSIR
jgi:hypothetical protein